MVSASSSTGWPVCSTSRGEARNCKPETAGCKRHAAGWLEGRVGGEGQGVMFIRTCICGNSFTCTGVAAEGVTTYSRDSWAYPGDMRSVVKMRSHRVTTR